MGHLQAIPDHKRPTLDELKEQSKTSQRARHVHNGVARIVGKWIGTPEIFIIEVKGDWADIREVYETLHGNGNLSDVQLEALDDVVFGKSGL